MLNGPALRDRLVPTFVELLELVGPVVRKLTGRGVVMDEESKPRFMNGLLGKSGNGRRW
jgi:hypothetical protein